MDLEAELHGLVDRHLSELEDLPWASEADRWAELVFCVLHSVTGGDPVRCRSVTDIMRGLGLVAPAVLAEADDSRSATGSVIRFVLARHELTASEADRAVELLAQVSRVVQAGYGGKLQRYLRRIAETVRDELAGELSSGTDAGPELRQAVAHWLQNSFSLPLSMEDRAVRDFCRSRSITRHDLEAAADSIDLNVAVVDDLIRLAAESAGGPDPLAESQ